MEEKRYDHNILAPARRQAKKRKASVVSPGSPNKKRRNRDESDSDGEEAEGPALKVVLTNKPGNSGTT